jgi:hypothetical protein
MDFQAPDLGANQLVSTRLMFECGQRGRPVFLFVPHLHFTPSGGRAVTILSGNTRFELCRRRSTFQAKYIPDQTLSSTFSLPRTSPPRRIFSASLRSATNASSLAWQQLLTSYRSLRSTPHSRTSGPRTEESISSWSYVTTNTGTRRIHPTTQTTPD